MARMEMDWNLKNWGKRFQDVSMRLQRQCSEWITLATTNFRIVWAKNLPNPRDRAPLTLLNTRNEARTFFVLAVFCNLSLDFHSSYCSITFIFPLSVLSSFFHTHCFQLVCGTALAGLAAPLAPFCPFSPLLPWFPTSPRSPFMPILPGAPLFPRGPSGPLSPFGPSIPSAPLSPVCPFAPSLPWGPCDPGTPGIPGMPFDPGMPGKPWPIMDF